MHGSPEPLVLQAEVIKTYCRRDIGYGELHCSRMMRGADAIWPLVLILQCCLFGPLTKIPPCGSVLLTFVAGDMTRHNKTLSGL